MVSLLVCDSPKSHPLGLLQAPASRLGTKSELSWREACHMVNHLYHSQSRCSLGSLLQGDPTQPAFPCRGDYSSRMGMTFILGQERLGWYGVSRDLYPETLQESGSRSEFCALTALAEAEVPYMSTSSNCSNFNATPGHFLQPLVHLVPAIVAHDRKHSGVSPGCWKVWGSSVTARGMVAG